MFFFWENEMHLENFQGQSVRNMDIYIMNMYMSKSMAKVPDGF